MKLVYKFIICSALLGSQAAILTSCKKDFLTRNPYVSVPFEDAVKTEPDMLIALRGCYQGLRQLSVYGRTIPVLGDLMGDNAYVSVVNSGRYLSFNQYTMSALNGDADGMWASAYQVILRCNNILNASVAANVNVNQYKGEAYAIRALCYFNLVRFFAKPYNEDPNALGVPIITVFDQTLKPARSTINEVYTLILADLSQAYTLMTRFNGPSQFSKYAARALEAKVRLTKNDMAGAKTAALDVINNSGFTALPLASVAAYWGNPAPRTDKMETIFEISSDAIGNLGTSALGYIYNQAGYGDMLCSDELAALYSATDVRKTALLSNGVRGGLPSVFVRKYLNISTDRDDSKVLRLSEMYLIVAEASFAVGNEVEARTYLNFVATKRDAAFAGYSSTGAALLNDILTERRKEFAFEGDRFHDLNRLRRQINRSANYPASARTIAYPFDKRLLPIPQAEMDANPSIRGQQNPGY